MSNRLSAQAEKRQARRAQLLPIEYPAELPVVARREELAHAIAENQVVIVCGETGSGKTTQLPKICLDLGRGVLGVIAHTQPRRVAARTVANRIAHELKCELGGAVGYKVRFNDKVSPDTCVKLMTDGILLAEIHSDPQLRQYDTIILDEAHERSLNIDFLLGYLKRLLPKRPDLKLIITSATLDAERFSRHFALPSPASGGGAGGEGRGAPVLQVSGRSYPVEIRYRPLQDTAEGEPEDVPQAVCRTLDELSIGGLRGDLLVFLPGEREIRETAEALRKHHPKHVEILPLFSRLSAAEQDRVFKPTNQRRVVLATNVAETSLTVPNIGYVIDSGLARVNRYSLRQKVEQLHIEKVSRAAANQRAGRCGRVMSGVCVRLYDEADFAERPEFTDAEIFRVSLATVILRMASLNLGDVTEFPFIEPPGSRSIADGYQLLTELGAFSERVPSPQPSPEGGGSLLPSPAGRGGEGTRVLTSLGRELAKLPLDPKVARLLLAGRQYHCLTEILIIASALSLQDPRDRPQERREAADAAHQRFNDERSDFLAYLKIWAWFQQAVQHKKSKRQLADQCRELFLSPLRLREWHDLHQQLHAQAMEMGMRPNEQPGSYEQIHKALLTGLLGNIGMKTVDGMDYQGARGIKFFVAPNSVLAKKGAKWVMAAELVETHKLYARCNARIEPQWLEEVGAHLIKRHYFDPHWEKKAAQVAAWERSTLFGLVINPKKRVHYGPMAPEESREVFIRQALVQGEFETRAPFFAHNQKLIRDIEALEHKARRPDVLVDDELIFAFYDARIPAGIHNGAAFEHWRKEAERAEPKLLHLKKDDLMRHEAAGITTEQFPPQLVMNGVSYALGYHFAPGDKDDGVTLAVPLALINQVSAARCEWLAPGLLADKVTQLLKTLPQKLRRHLVPVPEFAAGFCAAVPPSDTPLLQALARYIREQKQLTAPLDAFRLEQLPPHLAMNFRVVDEHGRQLGMSRNFVQLRGELAPKGALTPSPSPGGRGEPGGRGAAVNSPLPQAGEGQGERGAATRHTIWDFGDFTDTTQISRAGQTLTVFNALHDEGDAVTLRTCDTREEAQTMHRKGMSRLFMLALKEQVKFLEKSLPGLQALAMQFMPFGSQQDLLRQILAVTFERCCLMEPWPMSEKTFAARAKDAKGRISLVAQEIVRLAAAVMTEHAQAQKALQAAKSHAQAAQDIRAQLDILLGKTFIERTPYERLQHLPRYLKAINVRLEKLRANPARDAQQQAQLQPLQQQWQRRVAAQQGEADPRLEDFFWLLQELRVSLFAQELKTPVIVSVKRLEKALEAMGR
ncbi:ATP-dependent RNA helicase HrpA [Ferriphaselus sp. R-1]|uniref:ATP-dependent RNA helicase HrpA n=1 Tax=Ferriphaselus sp. R-1 TaxID=1485544 RepID=UPI00054FAAE1|nr:ATP-dependent RNA helicase HrpA [Ferriphaselus sp. R-1]